MMRCRLLALLILAALLAGGCRAERNTAGATPQAPTAPPRAATLPPAASSTPTPPATPTAPPAPSPTSPPTATPTRAWPAVRVSGPGFEALPQGWTRINPGGDTRCAHDTPFAFWVRPANPQKLLIFLQGGGGCWSAETCAFGSATYKSSVVASDNPANQGGIFDLDNPENPFADYSMVFIPSCTGDVHTGDNVRRYARPGGGELVIYHRGFVNASTAAQWAFERLPDPASVFVTGCSAGSAGSIFLAPYVIEQYPQARLTQLGDSLSFTYHQPLDLEADYRAHENFPSWIPALQALRPGEFTMARFYSAVAAFYPERIFSQYNTLFDSVQQDFYELVGGPPGGFPQDLETALNEIHQNASNFRSYTAAGSTHCILPFSRFYTQVTEGVRFRDWVAGLESGQPVEDIHCTECGP